jgi:hypothetical protein
MYLSVIPTEDKKGALDPEASQISSLISQITQTDLANPKFLSREVTNSLSN